MSRRHLNFSKNIQKLKEKEVKNAVTQQQFDNYLNMYFQIATQWTKQQTNNE